MKIAVVKAPIGLYRLHRAKYWWYYDHELGKSVRVTRPRKRPKPGKFYDKYVNPKPEICEDDVLVKSADSSRVRAGDS